MSDHLAECYLSGPPSLCPMCDALRACEQRVFQEQIKGRQHDMVMAYLRGLDAAREAVAALRSEARAYLDAGGNPRHNAATRQAIHNWTQALDAIDALRTTNP